MSPKDVKTSTVSFDILYGLGQELHAPLQSLVKSTSKLIADYQSRDFEYVAYKDFKKIMATLELMNKQLERCVQTTDRMIHLHQIQNRTSIKNSDINQVVKEVLGILDQQLKNGNIIVSLRLSKNLPRIALSDVEAHQVMYNIILNAVQAMPAGGKIKINTIFRTKDSAVSLVVEDEGVGIPPEHLTKVFEPFFTTKERGVEKNSGLGLSIVHAILAAARGNINIESSLRQGTVVCIQVPVYRL